MAVVPYAVIRKLTLGQSLSVREVRLIKVSRAVPFTKIRGK